jgi:hypothetical protein
MVKRDAMLDVGLYNDRYRYSADLEMYDRLLAKYPAANIPKQLLGIRRHSGQGSRTRVAVDEIIEIFQKRLSNGAYSPEDVATIEQNLSRSHIERARHMAGEMRPWQLLKDIAWGLKLSPKSFAWYFFKIFFVYSIGVRQRAAIKNLLSRSVSGQKP